MNRYISTELLPLYLVVAVIGLGLGVVVPLLPVMFADYGITATQVGLLAVFMSLGGAVVALPAGKLIDKIGVRSVMIIGLLLFTGIVNLFPYMDSFWMFGFVRFLEGICWALVFVAVESEVNRKSTPETRVRNLSYYAVFNGVGFGLGPVLGAMLMNISVSAPFIACGVLTLFCALYCFKLDKKQEPSKEEAVKDKDLYKVLLKWILAALIYGLLETGATSMFPLLFDHHGFGTVYMGVALGTFVLGGILTPLLVNQVSYRLGKQRFVVMAVGVATLCTFLLPLIHDHKVWMLPYMLVLGSTAGCMYVISLAIVTEMVPPNKIGLANGLFASAYGCGMLVGPLASGVLYEHVGPSMFFIHAAVIGLVYFLYLIGTKSWRVNRAFSGEQRGVADEN